MDAAAAMGDGAWPGALETGRRYSHPARSRSTRPRWTHAALPVLPTGAGRRRVMVLCQLISELLFADDLPRLLALGVRS